MDIRPIDPSSEAQLEELYEVMRRSFRFEREAAPFWSYQAVAAHVRMPASDVEKVDLVAYDGEQMIGCAELEMPLLDNTSMGWFGLGVVPEHRRRGVGSALLDAVLTEARKRGRTTFLSEAFVPPDRREDHPYRRFAEKHGFALANVEIQRRLDLPVDEAKLDQWSADAARHHDGYRIETYRDAVPEELVPSLCVLFGQLAVDAPTGDMEFEEETMTPELYAERQARNRASGRTVFETLAVDAAGTTVAQTTLAVPLDADDPNIMQWGTFVHREHRGRRLGMAVKAQNLREVQRVFPNKTAAWTGNSETNRHMVSINETMGFYPFELLAEFQKKE